MKVEDVFRPDEIDQYVDWELDNVADCFYNFVHEFFDLNAIGYPEKCLKDGVLDERERDGGICKEYFEKIYKLEDKLQKIEEESRKNEEGFNPDESLVSELGTQHQDLMQVFSKKLFLYGVKFGTRLAKKNIKGAGEMNIFKEKDRFCGTFSLERLKAADREFWVTTKAVDEALGEKKYLFNVYLSAVMNAINSGDACEAAEDGFKDCTELLCLCCDVYDCKKMARSQNLYYEPRFHEFYPVVKKYMEKYSEFQDKNKNPKGLLFLCIEKLFCKLTEYSINRFLNKSKNKISKCEEFNAIEECYKEMAKITGEELMERLNYAIVERFLKTSLTDIYLQSTMNQYLDCLTQKDPYTSEYVFRMVLNSIE